MDSSILKSRMFRETMVFAGLMGVALVLSAVFSVDSGSAASLIEPGDNLDLISDATDGEGDLRELVKTIINYFLTFLGFLAVIMVIYGGILYVTSAGNDESVGKAKKILLYAAVGIIIILLSYAIVSTILGAGLGADTGTTTTP